MTLTFYNRLALAAAILTFIVIVLGAWVRLTDAGLGCPDWPGCYGELTWPKTEESIAAANERWADRPVETGKAIREMVHRYAATLLGLMILILAGLAWRRRHDPRQPVVLPFVLLAVVIFQGMLGMWTVTLLLKPAIVLAHLAGGMLTFSLLAWLFFKTRPERPSPNLLQRRLTLPLTIGLLVLIGQILLGGWTSTNYAALACPDFPTCTGRWLPDTNFSEAFTIWREVGVDYEGGILDQDARVAIHLTHRIGALVVIAVFAWLLARLFTTPAMRLPAGILSTLLVTQITLGVLNVVMSLPLWVAVAHNGVAALLLACMVYLLTLSSGPRRPS
ncbi:MAG: COX15/CtaA family protein [Wenzhouxiangella sp.]|jgi:cytochrome c oxidase assembly protein subunit 15|nr:COX15/CtaA family protein [Wenzhouxiangella sp.]